MQQTVGRAKSRLVPPDEHRAANVRADGLMSTAGCQSKASRLWRVTPATILALMAGSDAVLRRKVRTITVLLVLAASGGQARALWGTPYEAQVGGLMSSLLTPYIIGEFGGRTVANPHFNQRQTCGPSDFADLQTAAGDDKALVAFHQKCRLIEFSLDETHVYQTAYLPAGRCEAIKNEFERMLNEKVYAMPYVAGEDNQLIIEYKSMRHVGSNREFARNARLKVSCQSDGSIRVSAPTRWQRPKMTAQPLSLAAVQSISKESLFSLAIPIGAIIGLAVSAWRSLFIAVAIVAIAECVLDWLWYLLLGSSGYPTFPIYAVFALTNLVSYSCWSVVFFLLKRLKLTYSRRLDSSG